MTRLRSLLHQHRAVAALLIALALLVRAAVPAGFMPEANSLRFAFVLCSGVAGHAATVRVEIPRKTAPGSEHRDGNADKSGAPCGFAGLAAPALSGADPILLAAAIAVAALLALRTPASLRVQLRARLRPPLRGPPRA